MKRYVTIRTVAYSRTYTAIILYTDLINDCNLVSKMQHPGLDFHVGTFGYADNIALLTHLYSV